MIVGQDTVGKCGILPASALPIEQQALAAESVVDLPVLEGDLSVHQGGGDGRFEGDAFEGRPAAFVFDVFFGDRRWRLGIDQREVGPIALADEAAFQTLENSPRPRRIAVRMQFQS